MDVTGEFYIYIYTCVDVFWPISHHNDHKNRDLTNGIKRFGQQLAVGEDILGYIGIWVRNMIFGCFAWGTPPRQCLCRKWRWSMVTMGFWAGWNWSVWGYSVPYDFNDAPGGTDPCHFFSLLQVGNRNLPFSGCATTNRCWERQFARCLQELDTHFWYETSGRLPYHSGLFGILRS
jgi:hypothetical protein